jgi:hypothetical protein
VWLPLDTFARPKPPPSFRRLEEKRKRAPGHRGWANCFPEAEP